MVFECWDITSGTGQGLLFSIVERSGKPVLRAEVAEIPIKLLLRLTGQLGLGPSPDPS